MNQKVYLALLIKSENLNILGIYSNEKSAIDRCMLEHSYSRLGWVQNDDEKLCWNNGFGLRVKVQEHSIVE